MFLTGFAPQKANIVVDIMLGFGAAADQLQALGPHKIGKSCLYLGRMSWNERAVLERLVRASVMEMHRRYTAEGAGDHPPVQRSARCFNFCPIGAKPEVG